MSSRHRRHRRAPAATRGRVTVSTSTALALALAAGAVALLAPRADAATYTFSNPAGGAINVSTNFTPIGVPGSADTLLIDDLARIGPNTTLTVPANQAIAGIQYSHYGQTSLNGAGTLTLQAGTIAFDDAITEAPGAPLTSLFINAPITSGTMISKTGRGFVLIGSTNTAAGGTSADAAASLGNTIAGLNLGGISVTSDAALGASGASLSLSNGGTLRALSGFTSTRTLNITGSGRFEAFGDLTWNGAINGSGTLIVGGGAGGVTSNTVTLGGTIATSSGLDVVNGATATLNGSVSTGQILLAGTLNVGTASSGPAANALADSALLLSNGGSLALFARTGNTNETTGQLSLLSGMTTIDLNATVNAGTQLTVNGISRSRGTLFIRGRDLGGGALAANRGVLVTNSTTGLALLGGGGTTATNASIVPYIVGNASATGGFTSQASAVEAGLVTYGATGFRVLGSADYATTIGANATDNVRITDGIATVNAPAAMNALVIRDTLNSAGNTGVTGTGLLTISSGAIVAVSDLQGEELFIDNPIDFGSFEGIVHTLPAADGDAQLTLRGAISGHSGLTKSGNGTLILANTTSNFSGATTIEAGTLVVNGDVPLTGNSALGLGGSGNLTLIPGANGNQYTQLLAGTANSVFARPISILPATGANDRVVIGTYGGIGTQFNGSISLGATLNLSGDADPANVLTFNGAITTGQGPASLQEPAVAFPQFQYLRLTGNNTYSGGTIIRAGEWQAGSDTAFGTGTITFAGNNAAVQTGAISAYAAARTLANPLVFRAAPNFNGTNALTFTGAVDLGSVNREIYVNTTAADTTFGGAVGRGGIVKRGAGRLILSGNNSYNGQTIVYEGQLRAASNGALGVAVGTGNPNQATFIVGTGSLELANNITTAEPIFLGSGGIPINGANPLGNLRSVSGSNTMVESIAFDDVATVGVDAGSTLTLTGDTLDNTTTATAALRKVGAGTLNVKNVRLNTLDVQAGTVRVTPGGSPVGTSRVSSLGVASGALLDLTNNSLVYDYTAGSSPQTAVRSLLQQGRIDTTSGGAAGAVGYAEASDLFPGATFPQNFAGQAVDNTTLLLAYTIAGDTNLDLTVNFTDLLALAKNYGGTGKVWIQGDFNYDGNVDFTDLLALAKDYNQTAPASASAELAAAGVGSAFAADWALAESLAPEPATLAALLLVAPMVRRRRR